MRQKHRRLFPILGLIVFCAGVTGFVAWHNTSKADPPPPIVELECKKCAPNPGGQICDDSGCPPAPYLGCMLLGCLEIGGVARCQYTCGSAYP